MTLKIGIVSDLHLEFRNSEKTYQQLAAIINSSPADVIVNAGDTHPQAEQRNYFKSLIHLPYYEVLGNHDFYGQSMLTQSNFEFTMNGVHVFGCTLWTDFHKHDPLVMEDYKATLVDARQILKPKEWPSLAEATYQIHLSDLDWIRQKKPDVVVTHHGPSLQIVHPDFRQKMLGKFGPDMTNYFFVSDLDQFILDNQNIKLWVYGHTHRSVNCAIGNTMIRSNQLGYPGEVHKHTHDYRPMIVEV